VRVVRFSDDVTSLDIVFDTDTNMLNYLPFQFVSCSLLIVSNAKYGSNPNCHFRDVLTFVLVLGAGATVLPSADSVTLVSAGALTQEVDLITPYNYCGYKSPSSPMVIQLPQSGVVPTITLVGPTIVGECSLLQLSTQTTGLAGRSGDYIWTVNGTSFNPTNCDPITTTTTTTTTEQHIIQSSTSVCFYD